MVVWIGLIVVVLNSGQIAMDSATFGSEAECKESSVDLLKAINEPKNGVVAYDFRCVRLDKMHKPGANA
jgi:hypothetical protein